MDKQHLLTIGNLSKQTGVHVKSLRYYEQLGILIPAYTDPDTGYRYYTLSQIPVVGAIRVCIFLDIPLKEFTGFLTRDQRRIHYKKLLSPEPPAPPTAPCWHTGKSGIFGKNCACWKNSGNRWNGKRISCFMESRPSTHCRKNTAGWRPMRENSRLRPLTSS